MGIAKNSTKSHFLSLRLVIILLLVLALLAHQAEASKVSRASNFSAHRAMASNAKKQETMEFKPKRVKNYHSTANGKFQGDEHNVPSGPNPEAN